MKLNKTFAILACLLLCATFAVAATQNAVVYGTVYDASGNPMPGVTVTLENGGLGFQRTTVSGSDGSYNFAEVPPSEGYRLTALRNGSKLDVRGGITVNVGDERVILPPLKEQAVVAVAAKTPNAAKAEVKEVKMTGSAVANDNATAISGVITGEQLRTLPLYNRNFLALGLLTPNTHDVPGGSSLTGASFSVAGTRPDSNNFLLDGSDNVASSSNQAIPFQVNDAIQEFRVTSSTANAEYGRSSGGTINVVTRRGGNKFHGSAYGYFGSDSMNAESPISVYRGSSFDKAAAYAGNPTYDPTFFQNFNFRYNDYVNSAINSPGGAFCTDSIGVSTAAACATGGTGANTFFDPASVLAAHNNFNIPFDSKQFGVNAGGAVIKDKLFLYGSYEGTLIDNPTPIFERVPSAFDRSYDALNTRAGYAPVNFGSTNTDFQIGQSFLSLFPQSNVVGVPDALEFYQGSAPAYTNVHNLLGRVDWAVGKNTNVGVRYVNQILDQLHDDTLPASSTYAGNGALRTALNQNVSISVSHSFSSNIIDELRLGVSRFDLKELAQDRGFDATTIGANGLNYPMHDLPTVLLNGVDTRYSGANRSANGAYCGWQDFCASNIRPTLDYLFPMARLGAPLDAPSHRRDTNWSLGDNLSWTHGHHGFKFGAEWRRIDNNVGDYSLSRGFLYSADIGQFSSDSESCRNCGANESFSFPSFDFFQQQARGYDGRFTSDNVSWYVQDTWRVHRRLTLNLGLRYEYFGVPQEANNQIWNFDSVANGLVQAGSSLVTDQFGFQCGDTLTYNGVPNHVNSQFPASNNPWTTCTPTGNSALSSATDGNWAPRVGVAWDVNGSGKSVLRFGVGWFHDQLPISYYSQLLKNRPTDISQQNAINGAVLDTTGTFCFATGDTCGAGNRFLNLQQAYGQVYNDDVRSQQPNAIYARDARHTDTPYTRQISFSWQQQWTNKLASEFGYIGTKGWALPQLYDAKFQQEWTLFSGTAFNTDNTGFSPAFTNVNLGNSTYNSMYTRLRVADFHGLRMNATYTFSNANDNAWSGRWPQLPVTGNNLAWGYQYHGSGDPAVFCIYVGIGCNNLVPSFPNIDFTGGAVTTTGVRPAIVTDYDLPQDPFHYSQDDWGRSAYDNHHKFVVDYSWDVPTKAWGAPKYLNDWTLSGIWTLQSGQPFTVYAGPILGQITERADVNGLVRVDGRNPDNVVSASSFMLPSADCFKSSGFLIFNSPFLPTAGNACTGNSKKGGYIGPNFLNMNFAVQKGFPMFGEGRNLTVRAEFYNLFNRANYYNPISTLSTDGFTPNPDFGKVKSAHDPRQVQLAVRFNW